jgi:hypothetical protein
MKKVGNNYDRYDIFGVDVPSFHIEGSKRIGSIVGCVFTMLLITMVIGYSCAKGRYVVTGDRPNISSYIVQDERHGKTLIDLNDY